MDLVEFLRARYDEEEAKAKAATPGPWRHNPDKHWRKPGTTWFEEAVFSGPGGIDAVCVAGTGDTDDPQSMADADHIAAHDPDRVRREVDAKRRILDLAASITDQCDDEQVWYQQAIGDVFRRMALPHADHPDYDEAWRPE